MRELEMSARTVEDAVQAACDALGVDRDDINVSYEVLEFPAKRLFKTIPAKVRVTVEEPETNAPASAASAPAEAAPAPAPAPAPEKEPAAAVPAPEKEKSPAAPANEGEEPLVIAEDARLQAAVDYLEPIFTLMGAENLEFTAVKKGEATILRVRGDHVGGLIGRRGETMESLSYLASLVVNRMEGNYVKFGLDVAGYRDKRENDLAALTARLCERVKKTGYSYEMEAMNPYERHIIHAAVSAIDGVRSESKGEGPERHVVIYSTDPNASNLPDRESLRNNRRAGPHRPNDRGPRYGSRDGGRGPRREGGYRGGRDGSRDTGRGPRRSFGGPRTNTPEREFANRPVAGGEPQVPSRTERIHDDDFGGDFGKIEL